MYTRSFYVVLIAIPNFVYYNEVNYKRVYKGAYHGRCQLFLEQYNRAA